jgi:hypothetical protein
MNGATTRDHGPFTAVTIATSLLPVSINVAHPGSLYTFYARFRPQLATRLATRLATQPALQPPCQTSWGNQETGCIFSLNDIAVPVAALSNATQSNVSLRAMPARRKRKVTHENATSDPHPTRRATGAEQMSLKRQKLSDQGGDANDADNGDHALIDASTTTDATVVSGPISLASLASGLATTGKSIDSVLFQWLNFAAATPTGAATAQASTTTSTTGTGSNLTTCRLIFYGFTTINSHEQTSKSPYHPCILHGH